MAIEDPSLSTHGYQLLPLGVLLIVGGGKLIIIEDP